MHLGVNDVYIVVNSGTNEGMFVAKPDQVYISTSVENVYPVIDIHASYQNFKPLKECTEINITEEDILNTFNNEE